MSIREQIAFLEELSSIDVDLRRIEEQLDRHHKGLSGMQAEVKSLEDSESCAIKCKGAAHCERDNRSLACRSFPYFPYFDPDGNLVGLAPYWGFEGQCWVISNPTVVDRQFVTEMVASHEYMFRHDAKWLATYREFSASMRRVFSRRKKKFAVLGRDGGYFWVLPHSGGRMVPAKIEDLHKLRKMYPEA